MRWAETAIELSPMAACSPKTIPGRRDAVALGTTPALHPAKAAMAPPSSRTRSGKGLEGLGIRRTY